MQKWLGEVQSPGIQVLYRVTKCLARYRSKFQLIEVYRTLEHGNLMLLDKAVMLNDKEEFTYHEMITHVPLFSARGVRSILIIGGGDGGTARECLKHKGVKKITVCEIDPEVITVSKKYFPKCAGSFKSKKVHVINEDGINFIATTKEKFDVILVDGIDPVGFGKKLFEKRFFVLAKKALSRNGVICGQCGSPFGSHSKYIPKTKKILEDLFRNVGIYGSSIPMYPSGLWTFYIAMDREGKRKISVRTLQKMRLKYFSELIHNGCYILPFFITKRL